MTSKIPSFTVEKIIIPGSSNIDRLVERVKYAVRYANEETYFFATGYKSPGLTEYESEAAAIKECLKLYDVPQTHIVCDPYAKNSVENILNALFHGFRGEVGIVSNPGHLKRFEKIVGKALEQKMTKDFHIIPIETPYRKSDRVYEFLAMQKLRLSLRAPLGHTSEKWYKKPLDIVTNRFTN